MPPKVGDWYLGIRDWDSLLHTPYFILPTSYFLLPTFYPNRPVM